MSFTFADSKSLQSLFFGEADAKLESSATESSGFSLASIRELEEEGFGSSLDSIIDTVLSSGRFVFLFFYADWCYFCKLEKPIIDELEGGYSEEILFIRLNEAKNSESIEEFGVEAFPTSFLIYGKNGSAYSYIDFRGFKDEDSLIASLNSIVGKEVFIEDDEEGGSQCGTSVGGLFDHESCSFYKCVDQCKYEMEKREETDKLVYEAIDTIKSCLEAIPGAPQDYGLFSCGKALATQDLSDVLSCLADLAGTFAKKVGIACAYNAGHLLADLLGAEEAGKCLGQCTADPSSYDQKCKPGEEKFVCRGQAIEHWRCDDECEYTYLVKVTICPDCSHCEQTAGGGVTCVPQTDPPCSPDPSPDPDPGPSPDDDPSPPTYPGNDHPDDNYDVSTCSDGICTSIDASSYLPQYNVEAPRIAILNRGFPDGMMEFLDMLNESYNLVTLRFLGSLDPRDYPVLIVPSGGLFNLETSVSIRQNLEKYVEDGGKLIVFSQQRGADFNILPGGEVDGQGWVEDQSCFWRSAGMTVFYPILSGQSPQLHFGSSDLTLDIAIDGYFTKVPSNSLVLLNRVKNNMPAMILYEYGKGMVLAGTLHSDYASMGRMLLTKAETALLRDMISWALSEEPIETYGFSEDAELTVSLPFRNPVAFSPSWIRFNRGDTVSITVNVTNYGNETANKVSFVIIDPYYNYDYVNVSVSIPPHESSIVDLNYTTTNSSEPGVWMVLYTLYNETGKVWSAYYGAFTLDIDIADFSTFEVELVLKSPGEMLFPGSRWYVPTMVVRKTENVSLDVAPSETRMINITFTPDSLGIWSLEYRVKTLSNITVQTGVLFFAISEYGENPDGWAYQGADVTFSLTSDKERYFFGENATSIINLWNKGDKAQNLTIFFGQRRVADPARDNRSYYIVFNKTIAAGSYDNISFVWPIGFGPSGIVHIPIDGYHYWWFITVYNRTETGELVLIGNSHRGFHYWDDRPYGHIYVSSIQLDKKSYLVGDNVTVDLEIINRFPYVTYSIPVRLVVKVYDPAGEMFFEEETLLDVPPPSTDEPGVTNRAYHFTLPTILNQTAYLLLGHRFPYYRIELETYFRNNLLPNKELKTNVATTYFQANPWTGVDLTLDRSERTYQARQEMTMNFSFFNKLSEPLGSKITVSIPSMGYENTTAIEIPSYQDEWNLIMKTTIPPIVNSGLHDIYVNFEAENYTRHYYFFVPKSNLDSEPVQQYVTSGDLGVKMVNKGGVDTNYTYNIKVFGSYGYPTATHIIHAEYGSGVIQAGETVTWNYTIPEDIIKMTPAQWKGEGYYKRFWIKIELKDLDNPYVSSKTVNLIYYLEAEPPSMLKARLEKSTYAAGEEASLEIRNIGGSAADYMYTLELLDFPLSGEALKLYEQSGSGSVAAGNKTTAGFMIPEDTVKGLYYVKVELMNLNNLRNSSDTFMVFIEGLDALLTSETDKKVYGTEENITVYSSIDNLNGFIENASLNLQISSSKPCVVPYDNMIVNESTVLCPGVYAIKDEGYQAVIRVTGDNLVLDCNGAVLDGISGGIYSSQMGYGILSFGENVTIKNCKVINFQYGIVVSHQENNIVFNNRLYNIKSRGINIASGSSTLVFNNTVESSYAGVYIVGGSGNIIARNNLTDNQRGIFLGYNEKNTFVAVNTIKESSYGVYITGSGDANNARNITIMNNIINGSSSSGVYGDGLEESLIFNNTLISTQNGINLRKSENNTIVKNMILSSSGHGIYIQSSSTYSFTYGTLLYPSDNNRIIDNFIKSSSWYGIYLYGFLNNTLVAYNTVTESKYGIYLYYYCSAGSGCPPHSNNTIAFNNIQNSTYYGIYLEGKTENNTIAENTIRYSAERGMLVGGNAGENLIVNNTIAENKYGIYFSSGENNSIYHNNIINNTYRQAYTYSYGKNAWNTSSEGNYWSDYTGIDNNSDGIGDTPYTFQIGAQDNYPFMNPNSWQSYNLKEMNLEFDVPEIPQEPTIPGIQNNSSERIIWEKEIPVNVTDTLNLSTFVGLLGITGKFYLTAMLRSSSGQIVARSSSTFYITDLDVYLILKPDKQVYEPDESISVYAEAKNTGNITRDLTLVIKKNDTTIYSQSFTLGSNESYTHTLLTASDSSFTLEGALDGFTVSEFIRIVEPQINVTVSAPDIAGLEPFTVTVEVQNQGETTAYLNITIDGFETSVAVPPSQISLIQTEMTISRNTTLTVTASGDCEVTIAKEITFGADAEVTVSPLEFYVEGTVEIPYNVTNLGIMETRFNITFTLDDETTVKPVYLPLNGNATGILTFNLTRGSHLLRYYTPFEEGNTTILVETPPKFIVASLPENKTFQIDQLANMSITLKNIGGTSGTAEVRLTVPGTLDELNGTSIAPGEEETVDFSFLVPDDLEEKYYKAIFELEGEEYEVKFLVQGIKIAVNATLDKRLYEEGENATLTLTVENLRNTNLTLFSRVNLGIYDAVTYFNLSSLETKKLNFSVPVIFDAGKMLYTVYLAPPSGRALYINAMYLYPKPLDSAGIILYTDKQVYTVGENVTIYANVTQQGRLVMAAPNLGVNTTLSAGVHTFSFEVPKLRSGTYPIYYTFEDYSSSYPIDIIGYSARIVDSDLDKTSYIAGDTLNLTLLIDVNTNFEGLVKVWVFDPEDNIIGESEINHTFTEGENRVKLSVIIDTNSTGLHALIFRIYAYGSFIYLASGARYFDAAYVDDIPPDILHIPVTSGVEGEPIDIYAMVTDNIQVEEVALYYRRAGDQNYTKMVMTECEGCIDAYNATIPASAVASATIEYYVTATDGVNQTTSGAAEDPYVIQINFYPVAVVLSDPSDITDNSMRLTWTESADADFGNYTIYRSTTQGTLGTLIYTATGKTTTSHTVTGLSPETTYYFTVRVYDTGGLYADSNQVSGKTKATPFPYIPLAVGLIVLAAAATLALILMKRKGRKTGTHNSNRKGMIRNFYN